LKEPRLLLLLLIANLLTSALRLGLVRPFNPVFEFIN